MMQKLFTGMLPSFGGIGYQERLAKLGLFSLDRQRVRGRQKEVA